MTAISNWYTAALQQLAAESYLGLDAIQSEVSLRQDLQRGNTRTEFTQGGLMKMPVTQATEFAQTWEVVYQADNDGSGFSATLMRRRNALGVTAEYTIAFRSTEYRTEKTRGGDWQRDVNNADKEIGLGTGAQVGAGFAFGQIHSMRSLWDNLKAGRGADGVALAGLNDFAATMGGNINGKVNVVGNSLGGHLANIFTELYSSSVERTTVFNSAGRGTLPSNAPTVAVMLDYFESVLANPAGVTPEEVAVNPLLAALRGPAISLIGLALTDPTKRLENLTKDIGGVVEAYVYDDARYQFAVGATKLKYPSGYPGIPGAPTLVQSQFTNLFGHATHNDVEYVANGGIHVGPGQTPYIFIEDQPNIEAWIGPYSRNQSHSSQGL